MSLSSLRAVIKEEIVYAARSIRRCCVLTKCLLGQYQASADHKLSSSGLSVFELPMLQS